ncbi:MAG: recombination mediator RecR [bacterium]|nr:recombination mediator RecR [bacterium]
MANYPEAIEDLIRLFSTLPGVGRKTAERYVFFLLRQPPAMVQQYITKFQSVQNDINLCESCFCYTAATACDICSNFSRDDSTVCVVPESSTIFAIEHIGDYNGKYHVLGGTINQLDGVGPEQLRLRQLAKRVKAGSIKEIIIAMNPDVSGEASALYIIETLKPYNVKITKLARGLPAGSDIEFADDVTLGNALKDRKII